LGSSQGTKRNCNAVWTRAQWPDSLARGQGLRACEWAGAGAQQLLTYKVTQDSRCAPPAAAAAATAATNPQQWAPGFRCGTSPSSPFWWFARSLPRSTGGAATPARRGMKRTATIWARCVLYCEMSAQETKRTTMLPGSLASATTPNASQSTSSPASLPPPSSP
jgi:hypothetical protein